MNDECRIVGINARYFRDIRGKKPAVLLWAKSLPRQAGYSLYEREIGAGAAAPGVAAIPLSAKSLPRQAGYSLYEREIGVAPAACAGGFRCCCNPPLHKIPPPPSRVLPLRKGDGVPRAARGGGFRCCSRPPFGKIPPRLCRYSLYEREIGVTHAAGVGGRSRPPFVKGVTHAAGVGGF